MEIAIIISSAVIALGIYNVWLVRFSRPSVWRGGNAQNMREEFQVYGLPAPFVGVIGFLKLSLATLLLVGIWFPALRTPAAFGMAALMLGAVIMHVKARDPLPRSVPALTLLALSLFVGVMSGGAPAA